MDYGIDFAKNPLKTLKSFASNFYAKIYVLNMAVV